jgi:hypothetical protein
VTLPLRKIQNADVRHRPSEGSCLVGRERSRRENPGYSISSGLAGEKDFDHPPRGIRARGAPGVDRAKKLVHRPRGRGIARILLESGSRRLELARRRLIGVQVVEDFLSGHPFGALERHPERIEDQPLRGAIDGDALDSQVAKPLADPLGPDPRKDLVRRRVVAHAHHEPRQVGDRDRDAGREEVVQPAAPDVEVITLERYHPVEPNLPFIGLVEEGDEHRKLEGARHRIGDLAANVDPPAGFQVLEGDSHLARGSLGGVHNRIAKALEGRFGRRQKKRDREAQHRFLLE